MTVFLLQIEVLRLLALGVTADLNEESPQIVIELEDDCTSSETTEAATAKIV